MLNKYDKVYAFTLAEVLMILLVIGIISITTIPSLLKDINDLHLRTAWKKAYAELSQAYLKIKQDQNGDMSKYFGYNYASSTLALEFSINISSAKTKLVSNRTVSCVNPIRSLTGIYKTLSGREFDAYNLRAGQIALNNGMQIFFRTYNPDKMLIFVDVNTTEKGPNVLGRDLFGVQVSKDSIKPFGAIGTGLENTCNTNYVTKGELSAFQTGSYAEGAGCSAEYLYK